MPEGTGATGQRPKRPDWYTALAQYERPETHRAVSQVLTAVLPYLALWGLMLLTVQRGYHYGFTLALAVVAAGLLVRSFIFLHDASHGSFFPSPLANTLLGYTIGIMTMTPYAQWRWSHLKHHASFSDLDRRGYGDIWLLTVEEYRNAPRLQRLAYRVYRDPRFLFVPGAILLFLLVYRLPMKGTPWRERASVLFTDGALVAAAIAAHLTIGLKAFLLVQAPILIIAWSAGVWIFYIQHQFEGVYWARHAQWDFFRAALQGSSYYRLPKMLQWFTGNIGLHHVHHTRPRIPNYHLQQCYDETPALQRTPPLTLRRSLRCPYLNLWDEQQQRLVSFRDLR